MPGAQCTRSLACAVVVQDAHEYSQRSHRKSPGIPARNGFNGFLRTLPGDRAFLSPSLANESANLTPASRRQDHTTSPSASKTLSSQAPLASIASNPASVTIAIRPSSGVDGRGYKAICGFGKPEYFFHRDWTGRNSLIRFRKLDFTREPVEQAEIVTRQIQRESPLVCRTGCEEDVGIGEHARAGRIGFLVPGR
jgi:hypothetical protein